MKKRYVPKRLAPKPKRTAKLEQKPELERTPKPERTLKRRRFGFKSFLLVFTLLILCGICGGAFYLWSYLESYEISRPEHIVEELMENIDYDFWIKNAEIALAPRLSHFEANTSAALEPHLSHILDVQYSMRQRPEDTTENLLAYTIRAGASDIGIVRFSPIKEAGHGFFIWGVSGIDMIDAFLDSFYRSITITVSQNALVELNGIAVSSEYLIECEYDYGATYQIHNLYGDVDIMVTEIDGQTPDAIYAHHDEYYFPITIPSNFKYNIVVPFDALVYADGERISSDNVTDAQIISPVFRGVVDHELDPEIVLNRYEFELIDVYLEQVITVVDAQGEELEAFTTFSNEIIYRDRNSESLKATYGETAEEFMRAYVGYLANVGGRSGSYLATLGNYMLRTSALYRHLRNAEFWAGASQVTYHELEVDHFRQYGDNYFTCEVYYNLTHRGAYDTVDMEMRYEVLFILSDERWLVINTISIDQ